VRAVRFAFLALPVLAIASCSGKDPLNPGTPIGTFRVDGKLVSNACGAAESAPDPWEFDVKLSRDHGTVYWVQGGPPAAGELDPQNHTIMHTSVENTIHEADPKSGLGFCAIERDDTLDVTFNQPITSFAGVLTYAFRPTDGSDCSDQTTAGGGSFAALPCSVVYTLSGTLQ